MLQPYMFEPMLTDEELDRRENIQRQQADATRGRCNNCIVMDDDMQSKCCQEDDMVSSTRGDDDCVAMKASFERAVLNEEMILMYRHDILLHSKNDLEKKRAKDDSNINKRFLAYKTYIKWINAGHKIGYKNRVVIPSCVVNAIRQTWPEENDMYIGFKAPKEGYPV